jgi:hypothetical protein
MRLLKDTLEERDVAAAEQEWDAADDTETAIDQAPRKGNAAQRAGDECQRKHGSAGDESESDDPLVADGIEVRPDECHRDDKMREGEPIRAVGEKGIARVGRARAS